MRYLTAEERQRSKIMTGQKIRECKIDACPPIVRKKCTCVQYDRPIVCNEKEPDTRGIMRCVSFRPADVETLQTFEGKDGHIYSLAWHRDLRKYVIFQNNKTYARYSMDFLSLAFRDYWKLADKLSLTPRRRSPEKSILFPGRKEA